MQPLYQIQIIIRHFYDQENDKPKESHKIEKKSALNLLKKKRMNKYILIDRFVKSISTSSIKICIHTVFNTELYNQLQHHQ